MAYRISHCLSGSQMLRCARHRTIPPINFLLLLCLMASAAGQVAGQIADPNSIARDKQDSTSLAVERPIERTLTGGETHSYFLSLVADQYLCVVTNQRGIDVVVALFDPDGKKLIEVNSPNGNNGPEPVSWVADVTGTYRLEVRALERRATAGHYEVKIAALRAATAEDRAWGEALKLNEDAVAR